MINKNNVATLYYFGISPASLAKRYGVSRQRICNIIKEGGGKPKRMLKITKSHPSPSEQWVIDKLLSFGIMASAMPYAFEYDLVTKNGLKIEVKYRSKPSSLIRGRIQYRRYGIESFNSSVVDFTIVLLGSLEHPACYILPKGKIKKCISIPEGGTTLIWGKNKHFFYRENWQQIISTENYKKNST